MVVRELVTLLSFRLNEAQLARAQQRMTAIATSMTMFLTLPIGLFGKAMISAASHVQLLEISLSTMLGSAAEAKKFMGELFDFAAETPLFQIEEIGTQAKKLLATGFKQPEIIPMLKMLGNVAAGANVPLERIVLNFSQVRAQGKLTGRELRDFAVAGVPLLDQLSKITGKTTGEIFKMIRSSQIPFAMVVKAFENMTGAGGLFHDLQQKMANTTKGRFNKLLDNLFLLRVELGTRILPLADKLITFFDKVANSLRSMGVDWKRFSIVILGVAAVGGPLMLLMKVFKLLLGPLRLVAIAIGIISLIVDDIWVWQKNGKSVLGKMFGDYEAFAKKWFRLSKRIRDDNKKPIGFGTVLAEEQDSVLQKLLDGLSNFSTVYGKRLHEKLIFRKEIFDGIVESVTSGFNRIYNTVVSNIKRLIRIFDFEGEKFDSKIFAVNLFRGISRLARNISNNTDFSQAGSLGNSSFNNFLNSVLSGKSGKDVTVNNVVNVNVPAGGTNDEMVDKIKDVFTSEMEKQYRYANSMFGKY